MTAQVECHVMLGTGLSWFKSISVGMHDTSQANADFTEVGISASDVGHHDM
jgi:hypothetical protein